MTVFSAPLAGPATDSTSVLVRRDGMADTAQNCYNGVETKCNEICTYYVTYLTSPFLPHPPTLYAMSLPLTFADKTKKRPKSTPPWTST